MPIFYLGCIHSLDLYPFFLIITNLLSNINDHWHLNGQLKYLTIILLIFSTLKLVIIRNIFKCKRQTFGKKIRNRLGFFSSNIVFICLRENEYNSSNTDYRDKFIPDP